MCCHQHPDNGHGLVLEKVDSLPVSPWTLAELRERTEQWSDGRDDWRADWDLVCTFLDWLGEQ